MNASGKAVSGAARAQWLSELGRAIDEAQWLAWRIGVVEGRNARTLRQPPSTAFPAPLDSLRDLAAAGEGLEK